MGSKASKVDGSGQGGAGTSTGSERGLEQVEGMRKLALDSPDCKAVRGGTKPSLHEKSAAHIVEYASDADASAHFCKACVDAPPETPTPAGKAAVTTPTVESPGTGDPGTLVQSPSPRTVQASSKTRHAAVESPHTPSHAKASAEGSAEAGLAEIAGLRAQLAEATNRASAAEETQAAQTVALQAAAEQEAALEAQVESLTSAAADCEARANAALAAATARAVAAESTVEDLQQELDDLSVALRRAEDSAEHAEGEVEAAQSREDTARAEAAALTASLTQQTAALEASEQALVKAHAANASLQGRLETSTAEAKALRKQVKKLQRKAAQVPTASTPPPARAYSAYSAYGGYGSYEGAATSPPTPWAADPVEVQVVWTPTGGKYHYEHCYTCHRAKAAGTLTRGSVWSARGMRGRSGALLTPCGVCNPPAQ